MEQIALHTRFAGLSSTLIGDALDRLVGMRGLTRFDTGGAMVGPALTVRTRPGDNLALLAAIQGASSGDILVVDAGGDEAVAVAGELLMAYALRRGIRSRDGRSRPPPARAPPDQPHHAEHAGTAAPDPYCSFGMYRGGRTGL